MQRVSLEQVIEALQAVGVQPGDGLLVHSAIQFLGQPAGGVAMYASALCLALGITGSGSAAGTLAVPTFNFAFARGEAYDPSNTPSANMGALSEYIRQQPESMRTTHPMQSLAVVGRYAADLAQRDTPSAFDPGSAFAGLLELDFKLLLLGASIQAVSMLHFSEQRMHVPYRYWKDFSGSVKTGSGWEQRTYRMFVRDMDLDPKIELFPVQRRLDGLGQWQSVNLNYGQVASCKLTDFVAAVDHFLSTDPWSLVTNRGQRN